jgi:DNA-binding LytR/AlgR family response regulator
VNILIVEDEPIIARRIERLTRSLLEESELSVRHARRLGDAREMLQDAADLVFLDLNLQGADGFDLLKTSVAGSFHTVVVSAYTDRAIEAFELGVLDFIAKPFGRDRLAKALRRFGDARTPRETPTRYLAVRKSGTIHLVDINKVRYLTADGSYSRLVLRDGSTELHDKSLTRLGDLLPADFLRIHRSHVVRLSEISAFRPLEGSRYEVELGDGTVFPVGRTRVAALRDCLA